MNNQYPVTNFPQIPPINPNPNPNFSNLQFNWAPPQTLIQTPIHDLPNSISTLKTLIQSSISTIQSISSTFPSISPNSKTLIQCQSNPNHWIPPSSLFHHSLNCPSPIDLGRSLETLNYPKTLRNDHNLINLNNFDKFLRPVDAPTSELCFSIDDFVDFDCSFFYRDCPGVVSSLNNDFSKKMFRLPVVLSVECGNVVESVGFRGSNVKVLPSEVWFVGREVEQWSDYPNVYSLSVCKAILCVECVKERDLSMWVIENSPRFGVVIDVHMRDHLCVLFRLCLRAMVREAACSYGSFLESRNYNPRSLSFNCPVLGEVSRWLTSQVSILYGEMNSRSLVVAMLRHWLSKAASRASLLPVDGKLDRAYGNEETTVITGVQASGKDPENETVFSKPVFVYQIAAAIAALHERSLLEERIRALRNPPRLTPYQRSSDHSHFSKKAEEEREKRPDYRPLIEHDSLLNQRQHGQGGNKSKTKEELLAEERDYKRRRMSYRGKKSKRSAKEVMRDIIEEYMDAIQHMGGIEDPSKGESDGSALIPTNSSALPATNSKFHHSSRTDKQADNTLLDNDYNSHDTNPVHSSGRVEQRKKESYSHGRSDDRRTTSRDRRDRDYDCRSPSKDRRHGSREHRRHSRDLAREKSVRSPSKDRKRRSREHRGHSRNQAREKSVDKRSKSNYDSSNESSHHGYKLQSSTSFRNSSGRKDKWKLDSPDRRRRQPDSFESVEMNDRYDPSETSNL